MTVEGPYGRFTFDDDRPRQIWVGGVIGITPFVARMPHLAAVRRERGDTARRQVVDLFHTTSDYSDDAIGKLRADADAAGVRLHVLHGPRDGRLTGDRIRAEVPDWEEASVCFCGPAGFGAALRDDFAAHGMPVERRVHQELFAMR